MLVQLGGQLTGLRVHGATLSGHSYTDYCHLVESYLDFSPPNGGSLCRSGPTEQPYVHRGQSIESHSRGWESYDPTETRKHWSASPSDPATPVLRQDRFRRARSRETPQTPSYLICGAGKKEGQGKTRRLLARRDAPSRGSVCKRKWAKQLVN